MHSLGSCDRASWSKCEERENQQDATIRCLLSTSVSRCFGHHYAHLQENKDRVLLNMVYCLLQRSTPHAVTHGLCSAEGGHNDAWNMLRQKLIIDIWLLHLVGFLSLHKTMHITEKERDRTERWSIFLKPPEHIWTYIYIYIYIYTHIFNSTLSKTKFCKQNYADKNLRFACKFKVHYHVL